MSSNSINTVITDHSATITSEESNTTILDWAYLYTNQKSFQDKPFKLEAEVIHGII